MRLPMLSSRQVFAAIALASAFAMAFALYLQHGLGLEPCPLCVFQRVAMISTGVIAALAALHNPSATGRRIYALGLVLTSLAGVVVAGRHVWLQHLPADQVPSCGPGLDYWLDALPLRDVMVQVFQGSGECAVVDAAWLGISLPGWTLVTFSGLLLVSFWQMLRMRA